MFNGSQHRFSSSPWPAGYSFQQRRGIPPGIHSRAMAVRGYGGTPPPEVFVPEPVHQPFFRKQYQGWWYNLATSETLQSMMIESDEDWSAFPISGTLAAMPVPPGSVGVDDRTSPEPQGVTSWIKEQRSKGFAVWFTESSPAEVTAQTNLAGAAGEALLVPTKDVVTVSKLTAAMPESAVLFEPSGGWKVSSQAGMGVSEKTLLYGSAALAAVAVGYVLLSD